MVTPYFSQIRSKILEKLDEATEEILVAVYWFTNDHLFEKLCQKATEGKKVEVIIHNDFINNRSSGLDFQRFIDIGGRFYFSNSDNPMHNKFCIIDGKTLINGSYNWTYFAESKNRENVLILSAEQETVNAFKEEFQSLKSELKPIQKVTRLTRFELDEFNPLSASEYLANDMIWQAKATNRPEIVETAFQLSPNNIKIQEAAVALSLTKRRKLTCSIGAGIKDNKYLIGVEKGTVLPISISRTLVTIEDKQPSCASTLYYGDNYDVASANKPMPNMGKNKHPSGVKVLDLPAKPAGEASLKMIFTIDIYGKMAVRFYSLDNGNEDYYSVDISNLLADAE